jgi:hypothetical protein
MSNLVGLYYQALSNQLKNPIGFQMATGSLQLSDQTTVDQVADAIPPTSLDGSFSGNPVNAYSANYGNIINGLQVPDIVSNALGTQYASSWLAYQKANASALDFSTPTKYLESQQALMTKWGVEDSVSSGIVTKGQTALTQEADNPVTIAVNLWNAVTSKTGPYGFSPQFPNIAIQFNNPSPISFDISNIENSADLSKTWASGSFGILADIFELGGDGSYSSESQTFTSEGFTMTFSCRSVSMLTNPITAGEDFNVAGTEYGAWMSKSALQLAYTSPNDASVWQKAADWNKYFGDSGTFVRAITEMYLADDINITMTSTASFSDSEFTKVKAAAEGGFWPFFVAEASGGYESTITHNSDGSVTTTTSSPQGVYILLGVATNTIDALFGS